MQLDVHASPGILDGQDTGDGLLRADGPPAPRRSGGGCDPVGVGYHLSGQAG